MGFISIEIIFNCYIFGNKNLRNRFHSDKKKSPGNSSRIPPVIILIFLGLSNIKSSPYVSKRFVNKELMSTEFIKTRLFNTIYLKVLIRGILNFYKKLQTFFILDLFFFYSLSILKILIMKFHFIRNNEYNVSITK